MRSASLAVIATLGLGLSACEGGGDPVEQAKQDALTANRAAAHPIDPSHLAWTAPGDAAPTVATVDQAYVLAMIANHREAIATSQTALGQLQDPALRSMAQSVIDTRAREIAGLQTWKPAAR
jgi:uncharacterized protein (DUF305 family)